MFREVRGGIRFFDARVFLIAQFFGFLVEIVFCLYFDFNSAFVFFQFSGLILPPAWLQLDQTNRINKEI